MGKSTISMAIFNSYVSLPDGISFLFSIWTICSTNQTSINDIGNGQNSRPYEDVSFHEDGGNLTQNNVGRIPTQNHQESIRVF